MTLSSYRCWVKGFEDAAETRVINAASASKARYSYWLDVREPWPDCPFTSIRSRKESSVLVDEIFSRIAERYGLKNIVYPGQRVTMHDLDGVLTGTVTNSGCYFDLMTPDGRVHYIHPLSQTTYYDKNGNPIGLKIDHDIGRAEAI